MGKGGGEGAVAEPEECGAVIDSDGGVGIGSAETDDGVIIGGSGGESGKVMGIWTEGESGSTRGI